MCNSFVGLRREQTVSHRKENILFIELCKTLRFSTANRARQRNGWITSTRASFEFILSSRSLNPSKIHPFFKGIRVDRNIRRKKIRLQLIHYSSLSFQQTTNQATSKSLRSSSCFMKNQCVLLGFQCFSDQLEATGWQTLAWNHTG